jgi:hypothetical protein
MKKKKKKIFFLKKKKKKVLKNETIYSYELACFTKFLDMRMLKKYKVKGVRVFVRVEIVSGRVLIF